MKRKNPDTGQPFKYGDWSECGGMRFWQYQKVKNGNGYFRETWRSSEKFDWNQTYIKEWQNENRDKMNATAANTRSKRIKRKPKWVKEQYTEEIKLIYKAAKAAEDFTGIKHEVDHIIPLQGELVSGLHVPWNLKVITKDENREKRNKFKPC